MAPSANRTLPNLSATKKLGLIVPSSNTAIEAYTNILLSPVASRLTIHYTRLRVLTLDASDSTLSQFSTSALVQAAQLLADAGCDAILWNGTSGMWTGGTLADDEALAESMSKATGVKCSTNTIATVEALRFLGVRRMSIAVPYPEALAMKCKDFLEGVGVRVQKVERMKVTPGTNAEIARTGLEEIREIVERALDGESQAVVVACTNWPAAGIVDNVEMKTGKVVIDSIIVTAWWGLRMLNLDFDLEGWGRLMRQDGKQA